MKRSNIKLSPAALISVFGALCTSETFALTPEAEALLSSPDAYVLQESDLVQGGFTHPGTLIIDSHITTGGIALDAENIIILETGFLDTGGGGSFRFTGIYAQDGGISTERGDIGLFSAFGSDTNIDISGDISTTSLFVFGSDVSIKGDVDLFGVDGQDRISIFNAGNTTSVLALDLDVDEDVDLQLNQDTNIVGHWNSSAEININAGGNRLEFSPLLTVNGFDRIGVENADGFFVNTPMQGKSMGLIDIDGDSVLLHDVQLNTIAVYGDIDLIIQQNATLTLNSSFSMIYKGDFTLLGTLKVDHPDPENTASFPFEVWPFGDIIIQSSGRVESNVDVSLLAGFGSFNSGDFINFGNIEMNFFFETEVSINPAGDFVNFGSIVLTSENSIPTTYNTFVSGGNTLFNNGNVQADTVNLTMLP